jgi:hypothetical protein
MKNIFFTVCLISFTFVYLVLSFYDVDDVSCLDLVELSIFTLSPHELFED